MPHTATRRTSPSCHLDGVDLSLTPRAGAGGLFQTDVVSAQSGACNVDSTAGELSRRSKLRSIDLARVDFGRGERPAFFGVGPDEEHLYVANEKGGDAKRTADPEPYLDRFR